MAKTPEKKVKDKVTSVLKASVRTISIPYRVGMGAAVCPTSSGAIKVSSSVLSAKQERGN